MLKPDADQKRKTEKFYSVMILTVPREEHGIPHGTTWKPPWLVRGRKNGTISKYFYCRMRQSKWV